MDREGGGKKRGWGGGVANVTSLATERERGGGGGNGSQIGREKFRLHYPDREREI